MRLLRIVLLCAAGAATVAGCAKGSKSTTAAAGAKLYLANCASCHQPDGKGVAGTFPPLAGNAVVSGDPVKVIHIVKYGLTGPVVVAGKTYNGMMPAWSPQLSDADIASALTYVRSSWGDSGSPVTADQVTAVSK
jgi:nitrite reductase (NO-forming) / hydroxylamine reductase